MSTKPIHWYARRYVEKYGFNLVPIEPGRKFPTANDWGNTCLTTGDEAEAFYQQHADWNMGLALGPSRMCSLDIDCDESFQTIIDEFGIDADELWRFPTIQGRDKGRRLMFRVPDGVELPYTKLNWPSELDPDGSIHRSMMREASDAKAAGDLEREASIRADAKRFARYTVFELRASCDGHQRQDVLPPSIHPDTGKPYAWIVQPPKPGTDWPTPPAWLLAMWQAWDKFKPQLQAACPWAVVETPAPARTQAPRQENGSNVIQAFNDAHDLRMTLERYGYSRKGKSRYLSPHTSTGLPGVVLFPDERRCFIHHASDPLCSDESGQPVNPFDLFCYYEHNNDASKAVKAAAELLGLKPKARTPVHHQQTSHVVTQTQQSEPQPPAAQGRGTYNIAEPLPFCTDKGKPVKHIENLNEIIRRIGVTVRYNVIAKEEEIIIPHQSFSMDNQANASLAWLKSECSLFNFPTEHLDGMVTYLADQNQYNPVAQWITSRAWDGTHRMQALFDTVTCRDEWAEPQQKWLKETLIKRWMMSAVAAAFLPDGVSAAGVLVFQGPQYLGKTKWFKQLVPEHLGLLKDGMLLRPDDKDSVKQICSFWLVELGELDSTFRKADIAALKSFITMKQDVLRRAYARKESHYARRTVFFGSVNPREFLHDTTGNRRYWTIECEKLDHSHGIDMQQCWAEAYHMWQSGEGWYLEPEEMQALNDSNEQFMALDPVEERIRSSLDWDAPDAHWRWEQVTNILIECGIDKPNRQDASTAGAILRKLNGDRGKRSNGKNLLYIPPPKRY